MENITLETLLVAQVLTLAASLKALDKIENRKISTDYEREAAKLINRERSAVLQLLAETRLS